MKALIVISIILCCNIGLKAQKQTNGQTGKIVYHINKVKEFHVAEILGHENTFLPGKEYEDDGGLLVIDYDSKKFALQLLRPFELGNIEEPIDKVGIDDKTIVVLTPSYKIILNKVYNIGDMNAYSIRFLYAFSKELDQFSKFVLLNAASQETQTVKESVDLKFNIPINPEKFVDPNTEVKLHDSQLKKIVFQSTEVLIKKQDGRFALDTANWNLTLDSKKVTLKSTGGFYNTYSVLGFAYNEQMSSQKFRLGDEGGNIVSDLLISWSEGSKHYTLMLLSTNSSEEYQFQEVQAINKFY